MDCYHQLNNGFSASHSSISIASNPPIYFDSSREYSPNFDNIPEEESILDSASCYIETSTSFNEDDDEEVECEPSATSSSTSDEDISSNSTTSSSTPSSERLGNSSTDDISSGNSPPPIERATSPIEEVIEPIYSLISYIEYEGYETMSIREGSVQGSRTDSKMETDIIIEKDTEPESISGSGTDTEPQQESESETEALIEEDMEPEVMSENESDAEISIEIDEEPETQLHEDSDGSDIEEALERDKIKRKNGTYGKDQSQNATNSEGLEMRASTAAMSATMKTVETNYLHEEVLHQTADKTSTKSVAAVVSIAFESEVMKLTEKQEEVEDVSVVFLHDLQTRIIESNILAAGEALEELYGEQYSGLLDTPLENIFEKIEENRRSYFNRDQMLAIAVAFNRVSQKSPNDGLIAAQLLATKERGISLNSIAGKTPHYMEAIFDVLDLLVDLLEITPIAVFLFIRDYEELIEGNESMKNCFRKAAILLNRCHLGMKSYFLGKLLQRLLDFFIMVQGSSVEKEIFEIIASFYWGFEAFVIDTPMNLEVYELKPYKSTKGFKTKSTIINAQLTKAFYNSHFVSQLIQLIQKSPKEEFREQLMALVVQPLMPLVEIHPHFFIATKTSQILKRYPGNFELTSRILTILTSYDGPAIEPTTIFYSILENLYPQRFMPYYQPIIQVLKNMNTAMDNLEPIDLKLHFTGGDLYCPLSCNPNLHIYPEAINGPYLKYLTTKAVSNLNFNPRHLTDLIDLGELQKLINKMFKAKEVIRIDRVKGAFQDSQECTSQDIERSDELLKNVTTLFKDILTNAPINIRLEYIITHPIYAEIDEFALKNIWSNFTTLEVGFRRLLTLSSQEKSKVAAELLKPENTFSQNFINRRTIIYADALINYFNLEQGRPKHSPRYASCDKLVFDFVEEIFAENSTITKSFNIYDQWIAFITVGIFINDIPGLKGKDFKLEQLGKVCGLYKNPYTPSGICDFHNLLMRDLKSIMDAEMKNLISDFNKLVYNNPHNHGFPRVIHSICSKSDDIFRLKCGVLELYLSFYNPYALLPAVALVLPREADIQHALYSILQDFEQLKVKVVEDIPQWLDHQIENRTNYSNFKPFDTFKELIESLKVLFKIQSTEAIILTLAYLDTLMESKNFYAYNIQMLIDISREPVLLQFYGCKNSYVLPTNRVKKEQFLTAIEDLLIRSFILHDVRTGRNMTFLTRYSNQLYKTSNTYLRCLYPEIHRIIPQQVHHRHLQYYKPQNVAKKSIPQLSKPFKFPSGTQEVPTNFYFFPIP